ncbi:flavin-containing monooxygenase 1-like [Apostichopus japonicus]|uniref:flavin-containing monooxygenase 1-like n=1 Tax=Stichopus japonicus TaxID=307972 RepID=UPI003AB7651F
MHGTKESPVLKMEPFCCESGSVKRIAIVGAGLSGLTSIKACLEEDLQPVCFERTGFVGGIWAPHKQNIDKEGAVYPSLIFNSSKEMSCFSDYPYPKSYPPYIRPSQQFEYLESYANQFGLHDYIRLNTKVLEVSPIYTADEIKVQKWRVRSQKLDQANTVETEELFDAVLICIGNTTEAVEATFPDQDKFRGKILHSCHFREGSDYKDEKVLVIGAAYSAGDISVDCCNFASHVFLSTKNGTHPLPRLVNGGIPLDAMTNTVLGSYMPGFVMNFVVGRILSSTYDLRDVGLAPKDPDAVGMAFMVNDEIVPRIVYGMISPKPSVERFTEEGVIFSDGTQEKIDTVILATGYHTKYPVLDEKILRDDPHERNLYLHIFATTPERPTLAVVGMTYQLGAAGHVFEMQARCAVAVFKGDVRLPCKSIMAKQIDKTKAALIEAHGKLKYLVAPVPYICQLSQMIGCYPSIWRYILIGDFRLARCLFFKPFYPYVTRLRGKHAWSGARQAIIDGMDNMFSATRGTSIPRAGRRYRWVIVMLLALVCGEYVLLQF